MPKFLFILEREYLGRFSAKVRISEQNRKEMPKFLFLFSSASTLDALAPKVRISEQNRKEMPKFLFILEREYLGCFYAKGTNKAFCNVGNALLA